MSIALVSYLNLFRFATKSVKECKKPPCLVASYLINEKNMNNRNSSKKVPEKKQIIDQVRSDKALNHVNIIS